MNTELIIKQLKNERDKLTKAIEVLEPSADLTSTTKGIVHIAGLKISFPE